MPSINDLWYIRFPDGQVLRAAGTRVLREQLVSGRLPAGIRLRRSHTEEWRSLDRFPEFADLLPSHSSNGSKPHGVVSGRGETPPPATIASRLDPAQLHLVGIGGYLEELLAALDATLTPRKLVAAVAAGTVLGAVVGMLWQVGTGNLLGQPWWVWLVPAVGLVALCWMKGVLARMTYKELSSLRPAQWRDGVAGSAGRTAQLVVLDALILAVLGGALTVVRWFPGWCYAQASAAEGYWPYATLPVPILCTLAEVALWPFLLMMLPLAPILVIEQCPLFAGLRIWWRLVRWSGYRLLLAEAMALTLAGLVALPLAVLLGLIHTSVPDPAFDLPVAAMRFILGGALLSVPLAYLLVANVFIYLRLNYDSPPRG